MGLLDTGAGRPKYLRHNLATNMLGISIEIELSTILGEEVYSPITDVQESVFGPLSLEQQSKDRIKNIQTYRWIPISIP